MVILFDFIISARLAQSFVPNSLTIIFRGSGFEVWGNCNAPRAITLSALIYCLRCMVGHDVPLNQVTAALLAISPVL